MKKIIILTVAVLVHSLSFAQSSFSQTGQNSTSPNRSVFDKYQNFAADGVELYESNLEMKAYKRFGLGLVTGGAAGLLGLNTEINLDPAEAVVIGLGTGPSYNSFNLGWKHNFVGNYLSPYTKVGYSKWFNSSGSSSSAGESDILKRVLTADEIKNNRFSADFIVASAGLEYNQLEGDLSGVNFFGELVLLAELEKTIVIPAGAVGIIYYY